MSFREKVECLLLDLFNLGWEGFIVVYLSAACVGSLIGV